MNLVISIAKHELELADRWFTWVSELGGTEGHSLFLIPASGTDIKGILQKANKAFSGRVTFIKDEEEQTSDWQSPELVRSAAGPNSAFRQVAWHFHHGNLGPYFWCELDCIPIKKDWLDRLESEYKSCGKPFMGAHVLIPGVREHMSGNAIYLDPVMNAPTLTMRVNWTADGQPNPTELAFDVAGAVEVIPNAHWTNLIQHNFRYGEFKTREQFDSVVDPNAVVFHSCKDGSIYKYLRENLSGGVGITRGATIQQADTPVDLTAPSAKKPFLDTHGVEGDPQTGSLGETVGVPLSFAPLETRIQESTVANYGFTVTSKTTCTDEELESVIEQNRVIKNGLPPMSPPWENREDSEGDIKMLCDALALFCKAPIYKSRVRNALREAKIIK